MSFVRLLDRVEAEGALFQRYLAVILHKNRMLLEQIKDAAVVDFTQALGSVRVR